MCVCVCVYSAPEVEINAIQRSNDWRRMQSLPTGTEIKTEVVSVTGWLSGGSAAALGEIHKLGGASVLRAMMGGALRTVDSNDAFSLTTVLGFSNRCIFCSKGSNCRMSNPSVGL